MTKSTNFNYYEADNVYGALFFQFPKVLMYGEQYKHLSSDAKLAYMVLKDRLEYSLRNNWVDEEGHVYFIFTNQELINLFNCSEHKVIKIKAELKSAGLLLQKQMGFNPKTSSDILISYTSLRFCISNYRFTTVSRRYDHFIIWNLTDTFYS